MGLSWENFSQVATYMVMVVILNPNFAKSFEVLQDFGTIISVGNKYIE